MDLPFAPLAMIVFLVKRDVLCCFCFCLHVVLIRMAFETGVSLFGHGLHVRACSQKPTFRLEHVLCPSNCALLSRGHHGLRRFHDSHAFVSPVGEAHGTLGRPSLALPLLRVTHRWRRRRVLPMTTGRYCPMSRFPTTWVDGLCDSARTWSDPVE